ncbi:MAG TPA: alpha/beta hydrolase [Thermodesulfobacteriota bacterium]|nr:alpha/beta hydrolase [Thermodesulfobacteriota bacterium]
MPKIRVADIEINYQEEGQGFPLVLVHGLNGDLTGWALVSPYFSREYRVIAPDVRGHGGTSKPDQPYSVKGFSQDLYGFMRGLDLSRVHLLGLSMGGAIAQQFALDHPEMIRSLILVSTFSAIEGRAQQAFLCLKDALKRGGYPAFFDEVVALAFTPEYIASHPGPIAELKEKRIRINSPAAIGRAADACKAFNVKKEISRIAAPTLVVSGREDVFTPIDLAQHIHESIRGSEWKIIDGVGHNVYIEKPAELAGAVLDFLKRH